MLIAVEFHIVQDGSHLAPSLKIPGNIDVLLYSYTINHLYEKFTSMDVMGTVQHA